MLEKAVAEERYDDAAELRNTIAEMTNSGDPGAAWGKEDELVSNQMIPTAPPRLPCESDVTTRGVNVRVMSQHVASRSDPGAGRFFFAYSVRITNTSDVVVQLRDRTWEVTDGHGRSDVISGSGVIGQQPVLLPGQSFEYASVCPLATSHGIMRGAYTFVQIASAANGGGENYGEGNDSAKEEVDALTTGGASPGTGATEGIGGIADGGQPTTVRDWTTHAQHRTLCQTCGDMFWQKIDVDVEKRRALFLLVVFQASPSSSL